MPGLRSTRPRLPVLAMSAVAILILAACGDEAPPPTPTEAVVATEVPAGRRDGYHRGGHRGGVPGRRRGGNACGSTRYAGRCGGDHRSPIAATPVAEAATPAVPGATPIATVATQVAEATPVVATPVAAASPAATPMALGTPPVATIQASPIVAAATRIVQPATP